MKRDLNKFFIPAASTSLILLGACGGDENSEPEPTDLLVGEWEVTSVNEIDVSMLASEYSLIFQFEPDGDFSFCSSYENDGQDYSYCYEGGWVWREVGRSLEMSFVTGDGDDTDTAETVFNIEELTESTLEGSWDSFTDDEEYMMVLHKL